MDGPSNLDIVTTIILMVIYGLIIKLGAKYNSFTLMFYGFLCIVGVNINTFLVEYPVARSIARVLIALAILGILWRATKLYAEKLSDRDDTLKRLSEYER